MKRTRPLILAVVLVLQFMPRLAIAQDQSPKNRATSQRAHSDDGFRAFYVNFRRAVLANNRTAVRNMMSTVFLWDLIETESPDQALRDMDKYKRWQQLRTAVRRYPVLCKRPYCGHGGGDTFYSGYRLGDRHLGDVLFIRENSEWKWKGLLGD